MEPIFIYFAKSNFISLVFWGYYKLFLEGKEFHHYNRFYLLISVILSLILPFIKVSWFTIQPNNQHLYLLIQYMNGDAIERTSGDFNNPWTFYLVLFIGLISIFYTLRMLYGIFKIRNIKSHYPTEKHENYTMIYTDLPSAPFTFLRNLFWNTSIDVNTQSGEKIFLHELAHITQHHTIDRLFLTCIKSIFWFNPMYYLIHKEVMLIHEYLADQKAIENKDSKAFAAMLLGQHFSAATIPGTSPFFTSHIKKRLDMITKNHTTSYSYARRVWALPLLFMLCFMYIVQAKNEEIKIENRNIEDFIQQQVIPENDSIKQQLLERKKALDLNQKALQEKKRTLTKHSEEIEVQQKEIEILSRQAENKQRVLDNLLKKPDEKLDLNKIKANLDEIAEINKTIDQKIIVLNQSIGGILPPPPPPPTPIAPPPPPPSAPKKDTKLNSKSIELDNNNVDKSKYEIYLDGKQITEEEMQDLDPKSIKNIMIDKDQNSENNKIRSRINIFTTSPPPPPSQ